jgi:hypothetical protein
MRGRIGALFAAVMVLGLFLGPGTGNAAVSSTPAAVPRLATSGTDGSVEQVRQLTVCNGVMYAVGIFTWVENGNSTIPVARNNAFAFSATAPYLVNAWNPNVNGLVDTVACDPDGSVLIGGQFTSAGGAANRNLAKLDAVTGGSIPFGLHPSGIVAHIEVVSGHTLVGGYFPGILTSVSPFTGLPDGYATPSFSGTYQYAYVAPNMTHISNMTPKSDASAVLITGVFTSVGGQHHEQVVRLNLARGPGAARVSAWDPTELEMHCAAFDPFYARDAAFSPDGAHIYVAATGYHLFDGPNGATPRTGPCDAAISYPSTEIRFAGHTWINYTGCDSLYSVAADPATVFFAGHERWANNPLDCDAPGPGAVAAQGLTELNPVTGSWQPGPNRGRGYGATDMVRTAAGLWVAGDNFKGTDTCNGQHGHMGICFFPN